MIVAAILFGAAFTVVVSWAFGTLLFDWLRLSFSRFEEWLLAFVAGSACLSGTVFALSVVHWVRRGILLSVGLCAVAAAVRSAVIRKKLPEFPKLGWIPAGIFAAFTILYLVNAMAPEMSPDGAAYHLGMVAKYAQARGFVHITTNIYANLSEGIELLFLPAFLFGRHSAAALVHFGFLAALALLIICYGRRIGSPAIGIAAAIFVFTSPVIGLDGSIAYVDVALAAVVFALFYVLQVWDEQRDPRLAVVAGILAGFSFAVKYTGFVAVVYAAGFLLWKSTRAVLPAALSASLFSAPWLVKNWLWVGNPFSPFANRLFPNPYVHVSFEDYFRRAERSYDLASYWQIPWQLTVDGGKLAGFFGPLFLLAPVALIALRFKQGRRLLAAGLVFAVPYAFNVGARFLIPAISFVSLSLVLAITRDSRAKPPASSAQTGGLSHALLIGVAVLHAVTCWPGVAALYASPYAWRLSGFPLKAALRIDPESAYLARRSPEYKVARMLERVVPPGDTVFSFSQVAEAYTSRKVLVSYTSAESEVLCDILWNPIIGGFHASRLLRFSFGTRELRKIRVVQTAWASGGQWSVAELRVFAHGMELARSPEWRFTARPNPWDVQLAFDNSIVTRWRSWDVAKPGMFIEVDFGRPQEIDAVTVETSDDSRDAKLRVDGMDPEGNWLLLRSESIETYRQITLSQRKVASAELKARQIRYILINKDNPGSDDFRRYADLWGIKCVGETDSSRLYYIE